MDTNPHAVVVINKQGEPEVLYEPQDDLRCNQVAFHASDAPNLLALGTRNTGKSMQLRWDAIIRCLMFPGFKALILRRTIPDLRKALALNTSIPTPSGWMMMGELNVGDMVLAIDGSPSRVLWKSTAQVDPKGTYRVTFDNGESVIASAGHQWQVYTHAGRGSNRGNTLTTAQIATAIYAEKDGRPNYAIKRAESWQLPEVSLPIDPYVLGVWLGDGTSGQGAITSADDEVVEEIRRSGYEVIKRPAHRYEWSVRKLAKQLENLGVLRDKYVPECYLFSSHGQRLALLQGLMDTDGWCREDHLCAFTQTNERRPISEAVYVLAASLGLKPRWNERPVFLYGRPMGIAYEVSWTGSLPVFRLTRKLERLTLKTRSTQNWHYIVSCERVEDEVCQCIAIDHPSHEYLVGRASLATHNSHLHFIEMEMKKLGGVFLHTTLEAKFPNGSLIQFTHCEKRADVQDFLSSAWGFVGFDELSTFELEIFLLVSAACRAKPSDPYKAVVRAGSNTLGIGSAWMKAWFVDHQVDYAEYPDYNPNDFEVQYSWLDGNKYADQDDYAKRLRNLPDHVRRSWLNLEFIVEGAYFTEFRKTDVVAGGRETPWHCIQTLPTYRGQWLMDLPWILVYRSVDWGYHPDPAVCHWHLILPNKRMITFKEQTWKRTLAVDVAKDIVRMSAGMRTVASFCDPTMFVKDGSATFSIAEQFELSGVPLTPSQNDRILFGYAVHQMLSTIIEDNGRQYPSWQIVEPACPELVRTLPLLQMDTHDPRKLGGGPDHWAVSCAYFGMGDATPSKDPVADGPRRWMQPKPRNRR